ncbi:hypothetical protein VYU27_010623, partial [Nannochloropsis oceanica]
MSWGSERDGVIVRENASGLMPAATPSCGAGLFWCPHYDRGRGHHAGGKAGHGEDRPDRILTSVEDERYALGVVVGVHVDPGTADNLTHGAPRQNLGLDDSRRKVHDEQTCPIDDALCRVYVLQQAVAETGISNRAMWKSSVIPTDLEVVQDIAVGGGINVANSLTSNV